MKYCLLINISRDYITFSYNKDGDVSFVPYGDELTKPLAVYCQGNEISIGSYALREVQKGNKYAHANLFDAIRSTDFIEYKGPIRYSPWMTFTLATQISCSNDT